MNDTTNAPGWAQPPAAAQEVTAQAAPAAPDMQAAEQKAAKEAEKARKAAEKTAAAEAREAQKAAKAQEKADKKAAKDAAILAKNEAKAQKAAQKEQSKMPEQNGVRRPKPEGECGKAWALFDRLSQAKGAPVAAAEIRKEMETKGAQLTEGVLNEGNVKAEYPRWKKFHGLSGMIMPASALTPPAAAPAPAPTA